MIMALFVGGRIAGRIDPRSIIATGLVCLGISNYEMSTWTDEVGEWPIVWTGLLQGIGAGIMLVPIQIIAFPSLAPSQRTEATSIFNLVRSVFSSVGVSVMLTMLVVTSTAARSRLAEYVSPYSAALRSAQQSGAFDSTTAHGLAILEREVERQALLTGYNADFFFLGVAALCALPLLLLIGRPGRASAEDREQSEMLLAE